MPETKDMARFILCPGNGIAFCGVCRIEMEEGVEHIFDEAQGHYLCRKCYQDIVLSGVCVNCGWCCRETPCAFGEWDKINDQCKYLTADNKCGIHNDIISNYSNWEKVSPAFGTGCCSTMNSERQAILRLKKGGETAEQVRAEISSNTLTHLLNAPLRDAQR